MVMCIIYNLGGIHMFNELLRKIIENKGSDLHLTVGTTPMMRVNGVLIKVCEQILSPDDTKSFAVQILGDKYDNYRENGEVDTSYSLHGVGRFRVNIFRQRSSDALVLRCVNVKVPTLKDFNMPTIINELITKQRGLILVTGPTGSGKSTTLAAMINEINILEHKHIITLEDPIEFLHSHNKSIVNQREVGKDTKSYERALKSALREDPDVILIGEIRDWETMSIALTAAETGHLVLSTLHTIGACKTIDRIVDVAPVSYQQQIRFQLATVVQGIISQQLLPTIDGNGRVAAHEIMTTTSAIQNLIRENKIHQIQSCIQTGGKFGMKPMDSAISDLYKKRIIDESTALEYAIDKDGLRRLLNI